MELEKKNVLPTMIDQNLKVYFLILDHSVDQV